MDAIPELITRRPTGKPPWPMLLIAGVEKAGKSYSGALLSASDLVDRTFWIEIGEGAADQYGAIPGARYEIVEHNGSYTAIADAVHAATRQPRNGRPHAIVIDSITELWDLLSDEAQATANRRARAKAAERKQPTPTGDAQITMDLWNAAKKRWRRVIDDLRVYDGPVVLLARLELVAVMDAKGKPDASGAREWKVRAEKNLPFEADAIVKMTAPQTAALTGVRSTVLSTPPGEELSLPQFTIDGLLRMLGLDAEGATSQRSYTAPQVEDVDALAPDAHDRQAQRQAPRAEDEWTLPPPAPGVPTVDDSQLAEMARLLDVKRGARNGDRNDHISRILRRRVDDVRTLSKAEGRQVIAILTAEPDRVPLPEPGQPSAPGTPNQPTLTKPQMRMLQAMLKERGVEDPDAKRALVSQIVRRTLESMNDVLASEVDDIVKALTTGEIPAPSGRTARDDTFNDLDAIIAKVDGPESSDDADEAIDEELAAGRITEADAGILRERLAVHVNKLLASAS